MIESFNDVTNGKWGLTGCRDIIAGMSICLSEGEPIRTAPIPDVVWGLTVPSTAMLTNRAVLAGLGPYPIIRAFGNIWGQCRISGEL